MPTKYTGASGVTIREWEFSQRDGWQEVIVDRGTPAWISGLVNSYRNAGFNVRINKEGPYASLEARRTLKTASAPFIERWAVSNEILTKDLYTIHWAQQEASSYPDGGAKGFRQDIEDVVSGKKQLGNTQIGIASYGTLLTQERIRGVSSYEEEYIIIRRERVEQGPPAANVSRPLILTNNRTIYQLADLDAIYGGIPNGILYTLPQQPVEHNDAQELNTRWGWRVRDQEAMIDADSKLTTRETWIHAEWSKFLYNVYTP